MGESVLNASGSGGGIDILSKVFCSTRLGIGMRLLYFELLALVCLAEGFFLEGDVEGPTVGGRNIMGCKLPLVSCKGLESADEGGKAGVDAEPGSDEGPSVSR